MADVQAFKGIHYNWERVERPGDLVAPPYDVIDAKHQQALYDRHPHNVVRLILNKKPLEGADNRYDHAAKHFNEWLDEGVLCQDSEPALYVYHQTFTVKTPAGVLNTTRKGFMARVRLHPYDDEVVLPHERTLRGPKIDRLRLNETVGANLSQVFLLYSDPQQRADRALDLAIASVTPLELNTPDGISHKLWIITDKETINVVQESLQEQQLLIADGHHRYETNLALRDRAIEREGSLGHDDARRFVLAYLSNGADPDLLVLPTHRVVHDLPNFDPQTLLTSLSKDFSIEALEEANMEEMERSINGLFGEEFAFGLLFPGDPVKAYYLRRRRDADNLLANMEGPVALQKVDLALLHELIFKGHMGMTDEDFTSKRYLRYEKGLEAVQGALGQADAQAIFLVNASPVSEVREVCLSGGKMPQKSTFFYPKVLAGLVFHSLS